MNYTIIVCPHCEADTLPRGAYRTRCAHCGTLFAASNETPDDVLDRERHRYAVAGKAIIVTPVDPRTPEVADLTGTTMTDTHADVERRLRVAIRLLEAGAYARVMKRQAQGKIH